MAKSNGAAEVNKSDAIRGLLKVNAKIKASDAVAQLAEKGVVVTPGLFYMVKSKAVGRRKKRKKREGHAASVVESATTSHSEALATIMVVKKCAIDVGGMKVLKKLVDALSE